MEWFLGLVGALVVSFVTARLTAQNEQKRLHQELKLERSVEDVIAQLLDRQGWGLRSFKTIKHHVRGFDDDKLRQYLVRSGAIAFEDKDQSDPDKRERWGLLKNNLDRLKTAQ